MRTLTSAPSISLAACAIAPVLGAATWLAATQIVNAAALTVELQYGFWPEMLPPGA
ncbi:MAG TPA: hypothetical protein VLJ38_10510 [Polyangiaceae bacterium]|nr:hypothetical protein [Polyangiaceae bacterium]